MKKITLVLTVVLFSFQAALQAQDFRFGFQVSPSFSWITTDDNRIEGNGSNLGLRLGMLGERYFAENYAIMFGLGFAFNQGGTIRHELGGQYWTNSDLSATELRFVTNGTDLKYKLQYLELPFALKMRTNTFGYMRGFFEIPRFVFGFNTKALGDIDQMGSDLDSEDEKINEDVNFFNLSWGLGGGLEYEVSENTSLVAGIFYNHGFLDITKDKGAEKNDGTSENSKGTIRGITIRLGVLF